MSEVPILGEWVELPTGGDWFRILRQSPPDSFLIDFSSLISPSKSPLSFTLSVKSHFTRKFHLHTLKFLKLNSLKSEKNCNAHQSIAHFSENKRQV